jgi:Co/Zn/Cd efflux system component
MDGSFPRTHSHVFLGEGHEQNERRTWMVIALCSVMMVAEIVGWSPFASWFCLAGRAAQKREYFAADGGHAGNPA